jgi:hypothetical protein
VFLAFATLTSTRNTPYILLTSTAIILRSGISFNLNARLTTLRFLKNFYYPVVFIVILAVLAFWSFATFKNSNDLKIISQNGNYPNAAVTFLKNNKQQGKMFNEYNWGGFLIWQLPEYKTFIDGRMPGWKNDDRDILTDYLKIYKVSPETNELLGKYDVSWAILSPDAPITTYLKLSGWIEVYTDKTAVILQKKV